MIHSNNQHLIWIFIQTGAITAIVFLILAFIFLGDVVSFVVSLMGQMIDIPKATGTSHLEEEDQNKEKTKLHDFLVNCKTFRNFL